MVLTIRFGYISRPGFRLGNFDADAKISYQLKKADSLVYVFLISGELEIGAETLNQRDGLCIEQIASAIDMKITRESKVLLMEIPG